MRVKKIQLIHPENDDSRKTTYHEYPLPKTHLEIIASVLKTYGDFKIEILDGESIPKNELVSGIGADIVGVTDWYSNHRNALNYLKHAKEKNPETITVIGGPNAAHLATRILRNNLFVDYVITRDGEYALSKLAAGYEKDKIENLWYREEKEIKFTYYKDSNLNALPVFTLDDLVDFDLTRFDSRHVNSDESVPTSFIRGRIKAAKSERCSYCTITTKKIRVMKPENVWKQVLFLNEKYGINYFFETGDTFIVGDYPYKLLEKKPKNLKARWVIYAMPSQINDENIGVLNRLGVEEIIFGIENVDSDLLKNVCREVYNEDSAEKKIKLLRENGINPRLFFLCGLPGESEDSANKNCHFAARMKEKYKIEKCLVQLVIPVVGSDLFNRLTQNKKIVEEYNKSGKDLFKDDDFDYAKLTELFIDNYCKVPCSKLLKLTEDYNEFFWQKNILKI